MVQAGVVGAALVVPLSLVHVEQEDPSKLYLAKQLLRADMADVRYTKTYLYVMYSFQLHHYEIS